MAHHVNIPNFLKKLMYMHLFANLNAAEVKLIPRFNAMKSVWHQTPK